MKQTGLKRITAWLLLFALALASGCGKNTGPNAASPAEGSGENGKEGTEYGPLSGTPDRASRGI